MNDANLLRAALEVLARRTLALLGLILDFALFLWAMIDPSLFRIICACAFGVVVLALLGLSRFLDL